MSNPKNLNRSSEHQGEEDTYFPVCGEDRMDMDCFLKGLQKRNPGETNFHQAVEEVATDVFPFINDHPEYRDAQVFERLTEPDRSISFRVTWEDDHGNIRANRGWRVQFCNALGPYKGGLRFHKNVNLDILKFLGYEQCFKNALTGLPIGGAKGGSNFNPKGKSDREIMRFCKAFMMELHRHIGPDIDVPAGDIGVGAKEISFLFGEYKRLQNKFHGVLTGKNVGFGGSLIRKEATGYGNVFFATRMLEHADQNINGKRCVISGAGNVAIYTAEKAIEKGCKVLTLSDSKGMVYASEGIDQKTLDVIKDIKEVRGGSLAELPDKVNDVEYYKEKTPWDIECDLAFPCATQNELDEKDAKTLIKNGVKLVCEGANMPCTQKAINSFYDSGVIFGPAKAANAGGVSVSSLELTQNAMRLTWSSEGVAKELEQIMQRIHDNCVEFGQEYGRTNKSIVDYKAGANIAGFKKLGDAILAYGVV